MIVEILLGAECRVRGVNPIQKEHAVFFIIREHPRLCPVKGKTIACFLWHCIETILIVETDAMAPWGDCEPHWAEGFGESTRADRGDAHSGDVEPKYVQSSHDPLPEFPVNLT